MTTARKLVFALVLLSMLTTLGCVATTQTAPPAPTAPRKVAVEIESEPGNAEIYIDGKLIGTTPLEYRLAAGTYKIELTRVGYRPWTRDLAITDVTTKLTALLERE
jgi:hypothetical protein